MSPPPNGVFVRTPRIDGWIERTYSLFGLHANVLFHGNAHGCVIVCITADSWPFHTSEWPLGIVYMDLDLAPSRLPWCPIGMSPIMEFFWVCRVSQNISTKWHRFTLFQKTGVKMYHPFKIVCPKLYSCLLI